MGRTVLITVLCLALALLGVSGLHAHVSSVGPSSSHEQAEHSHGSGHPIELMTLIDADHFHAHDQHGDVDIDSLAKAFGKLSLLKFFTVLAFVLGFIELLSRLPGQPVRVEPPRRPPKNRLRFSLLPPSHAPPTAA